MALKPTIFPTIMFDKLLLLCFNNHIRKCLYFVFCLDSLSTIQLSNTLSVVLLGTCTPYTMSRTSEKEFLPSSPLGESLSVSFRTGSNSDIRKLKKSISHESKVLSSKDFPQVRYSKIDDNHQAIIENLPEAKNNFETRVQTRKKSASRGMI